MQDRKALIVWGGWDGHEPEQVAAHFAEVLQKESFDVTLCDTLDAFIENELSDFSLIVPVWTMGEITPEQSKAVCTAVIGGVGIAGCHGGMCDSFRSDTDWQFMTGGQWVAHPGDNGVTYNVNICKDHEITRDLKDFEVTSEQYYLHTDPGNEVLATCDFPHPHHRGPHMNNPCKMPTVWVKTFGIGRVFYSALGHNRAVFDIPEATELMRRGFLWAAK